MSDPLPQTSFNAPDVSYLATLFPGYEIESLIATGGMGAVYCATQRSLDRTVAIKILPPELSADAAFRAGFEAEAKAMARLNHPNLIGVYDFGEVGGMLYLIMEFVPGKSIHHSAHGIAIDPMETVRLVSSICHGLAHAHENGIIHRDIKPANILLDLNAQPKIGDFGLARPHDKQVREGDEIFGTPHYTAPEVTTPPYTVCHRADIFSVGVMLHELLTGRLPAEDPRPASAIVRCDPRFDAIIHRATRHRPEQRYFSAAEMARDLEAIAATGRPKAGPPTARMGAPTARMGTHSPQARTSRPRAPQRGNCRPPQKQNKSSSAASVLKVLGLLGLVAFGYVQYQNRRQTIRESLKIEQASSMSIKDGGNVTLSLVRFTYHGNAGVLLWKSEPGIELVAGPENSLQSLSGHKLRYGALTKTNYVNSDFTVASLPDEQIAYSSIPQDYNRPEITNLLPVIRQ
ncbi:MAG: serine/threonine-protein kinase [Luteolibacter sp.]|uniref:serine/threonine protein kinase n=1 Tax=Luteolibacter sp. TaxID=1962973 RepID=UPI003265DDFC